MTKCNHNYWLRLRFVRIQAENGWKVSEDCYLIDEDETEVGICSLYLMDMLEYCKIWKVYCSTLESAKSVIFRELFIPLKLFENLFGTFLTIFKRGQMLES